MRVNVLGPIRHMISIGNSTVSRGINFTQTYEGQCIRSD